MKKSTHAAAHRLASKGARGTPSFRDTARSVANTENDSRANADAGALASGNDASPSVFAMRSSTTPPYVARKTKRNCARGLNTCLGAWSAPARNAEDTTVSPVEADTKKASTDRARPARHVSERDAASPGAAAIDKSAVAARTASLSRV